jgi:redox-sensitive bicupin YhaK (pirin superfamily)
LQRAIGFGKTREFDPFLLLDDFRNDNLNDYAAGFPWHPHRGIGNHHLRPGRLG